MNNFDFLTSKRCLWCVFLGLVTWPNGCYGDPPKANVIQGNWWILGNVTRGTLQIAIDSDNKLSGSIYNQPIRGSWRGDGGEFSFVRYHDENATMPLQSWTGKVVEVDCNDRKAFVLEGTFRTLDSDSKEEKKREYHWTGQSVESPAPNLDLKNLQGEWQLTSIFRCLHEDVKLSDDFGLNSTGVHFLIQGNQVVVNDQVTGTIANDLQSATLAKQVGFDGSRVMVLSTTKGRGFICSYFIENDIVEIAYPHTTSCHRGSGHILRLKKLPQKSSDQNEANGANNSGGRIR